MLSLLRRARVLALCCLAGFAAAADAPSDDDALEIQLWPLVQYGRLPDGKHRALVLFLFHRTTEPDGRLYSTNYLAWIEAPEFTALLPLFCRIGPPERRETMVVPAWFHGPRHDIVPPLLSASWRRADGGRTTWLTPLAHLSTAADGHVSSLHVLNWVQGERDAALLPIAYAVGEPGGRHVGVVPLAFSGPDGWFAPPLLSGGWHSAAGATTWLTPLAHWSTTPDGSLASMHVGPYVHAGDVDTLFPIAWSGDDWAAVVPLWFQAHATWVAPPALSAHWREDDGGASTWLTPLAHWRTDARGEVASWHALNVFHGAGVDTIFPLAWRFGEPGARTGCVLPVYVQTRSTIIVPPLVYAARRRDADGTRGFGVLPLWLQGSGWWCSPATLSGGARDADGATATWITPLFHTAASPAKRTASEHALTYVAWRSGGGVDADGVERPLASHRLAFPLFWRSSTTVGGQTDAWTAVLPFAITGPTSWVVPPLLTASWRSDGGRTTWVTPLAHRTTRSDGSVASQHALTWIQDDQRGIDDQGRPTELAYRLLFPLWYHQRRVVGGETTTNDVVMPLWFSGRDYRVVPPLLSAWHREPDGGSTTWATPLFHLTRDGEGAIRSMHVLNYVAGRDRQALLPIAYRVGPEERRRVGVVPLWFQGPDYRLAPPLLSFWRRFADGSTTTWLTPLAHVRRDAAGRVTAMHVATYVRSGDTHLLLPLAYASGPAGARHVGVIPAWFSGPGYWLAPPALSGGWTTADGGHATWLSPLAHWTTDQGGSLLGLHVGPYLHDRRHDLLLPIAWSVGEPGARSRGVLPLWLGGPDYDVVPPLLSGSWRRADGGRSTWLTPLAHVATGADGAVRDWHALNVVHTRDTDALLPIAWLTRGADGRSGGVLPLYVQGPRHLVVAPLFYDVLARDGRYWGLAPLVFAGPTAWAAPALLSAHWRSGSRATTVATPLYHRTTEDGRLVHEHLLAYVGTPSSDTVLPVFWRWTNDLRTTRTVLFPLVDARTLADGDRKMTLPPVCFSYHRGERIDTSLAYQLVPFLVQRGRDSYEVNVLWWTLHIRSQDHVTETYVFPLWHSEHHDAAPAKWQVLGGLFGRQTNYHAGTTRLYALWLIPLGRPRHYAAPTTS